MARTGEKNRWLIAASAMLVHLSIGSVYAYSVYQRPLQETQGWTVGDVTLGFTVAIFTLGLSTGLAVMGFGSGALVTGLLANHPVGG